MSAARLALLAPVVAGVAQRSAVPSIELSPPDASLSEGFTSIIGVRELNDGRLLIGDRADLRVVVVDMANGVMRDVAVRGRGPGEVNSLERLVALPGDSTLIEDFQTRRWIVLAGDRVVATLSLPRQSGAPAPRAFGADGRGRVLDIRPFAFRRSAGVPYTPLRSNADSLLLLIRQRARGRNARTPGTVATGADTIARVRGRAAGQTLTRRATPPPASLWLLESPLAVEDQAYLFEDGWLAVAYAEPYRVDWWGPGGERIRGRPLPHAPVDVDARMQQALVRWHWPLVSPPFTSRELPPWPQRLPPFLNEALVGMADGRLAIRRAFNPRQPATEYDVVDRRAELSARLQLPSAERIAWFGRRFVYTIHTDDDQLQTVRRHAWRATSGVPPRK